jgi:anti-anti-sigma factor
MLTVTSHARGSSVRVSLTGRLDGSPCCEELAVYVKDALEAGGRQFVFDLAGVEWLSSCGIGCLVKNYASVRRAGGSLVLRSPNRRVLRSLTVTRLVPQVFEVIDGDVNSSKVEEKRSVRSGPRN